MKNLNLRPLVRAIFGTRLSNRELGRQHGIAHNTISRYKELIHTNSYELESLMAMGEEDLQALFRKRKAGSSKLRLPDFAYIDKELGRPGVTQQLLWIEYKQQDPDTGYEISRFNDLYFQWKKKQRFSMRLAYAPGERGWVDFSGTRMEWVDPDTGEVHPMELFVASVGTSSLLYVLAVSSQKTEHWIHAHVNWFDYLGGVPETVVPDNLKAAVIKAGNEPVLNRAYQDMAEHYDTHILAARSRHPKDKALVEGSVLIFKRCGIAKLRNRVFHSAAELNAAIAECVEVINTRVMRRYNQTRRERFEALDKPALLPLSVRYEYCDWLGPVRVPLDYHVNIKGHYYSVPHRYIKELVNARCTVDTVEILSGNQRIASHPRSNVIGAKTTNRDHLMEQHRAWADHTRERYLGWAKQVGMSALQLVTQIFEGNKEPAALKACSNLQPLLRKHGEERFEQACAKALAIHSPSVKSVRSILQHGLETTHEEIDANHQIPIHGNVRGADYYQNQEFHHAQ